MTQNNEQDGKLTLSRPGRLELKKTVETGQVRQSFSHGRTKSVTVEVRKKRTFERGAGGSMQVVQEHEPLHLEAAMQLEENRNLTERERAARVRALHDAAIADEERKRIDEIEEERQRLAEAETKRKRQEAEDRRRVEEDSRRVDDESRRTAETVEEVALRRPDGDAPPVREPVKEAEESEDDVSARRPGRKVRSDVKRPTPGRGRDMPRRRDSGRLTISQALTEADSEGSSERARSLASMRRARERERQRILAEQRR
ncbi:MAG: translation initiation factor IF-2 associated domain-containing protein, partial [Alphaproteobacteria bacterium]